MQFSVGAQSKRRVSVLISSMSILSGHPALSSNAPSEQSNTVECSQFQRQTRRSCAACIRGSPKESTWDFRCGQIMPTKSACD